MDTIASMQETVIPLIIQPTQAVFLPLLEARRAEIESVKKQTFKYGATDRHMLDVYYPPTTTRTSASEKSPIVVFFYGGGLHSGDRVLPSSNGLVYTNVGAFYAQRGFVTMIADYRLVPDVKFPAPVEDVRDAIAWVSRSEREISAGGDTQADTNSIFIMGHSAGSFHITTALLLPGFFPADVLARVRGIVLIGGPFRLLPASSPIPPAMSPAVVQQYFGSEEVMLDNMPITLLGRAPKEAARTFPRVLMAMSEKEPVNIEQANKEFAAALTTWLGYDVRLIVMKDHNHISPHWSLSTGEGQDWADEVAEWIRSILVSP